MVSLFAISVNSPRTPTSWLVMANQDQLISRIRFERFSACGNPYGICWLALKIIPQDAQHGHHSIHCKSHAVNDSFQRVGMYPKQGHQRWLMWHAWSSSLSILWLSPSQASALRIAAHAPQQTEKKRWWACPQQQSCDISGLHSPMPANRPCAHQLSCEPQKMQGVCSEMGKKFSSEWKCYFQFLDIGRKLQCSRGLQAWETILWT